MHQDLTETPTAIGSVTESTAYTLQNQSERPMWLLDDAASAPSSASDTEGAFLIAPYAFATFSNGSGNESYVWLDPGSGLGLGGIAYSEAA